MGVTTIRETSSVCPVCLKNLPAELIRYEGQKGVYLQKNCPEHGEFTVPVWKDRIFFEEWTANENPLTEEERDHCSGDCITCQKHLQGTCCVLLEVTERCNLHCRFCFANGGESVASDPSYDTICGWIDDITKKAGKPLLQFSGGEPTLRDDLPDLVRYAKHAGCSFTQLNTNGIRLSEDEAYVKALAEAGLDIVFLQFDGTEPKIYEELRINRSKKTGLFENQKEEENLSICSAQKEIENPCFSEPEDDFDAFGLNRYTQGQELFEKKIRAILLCGKYGIGVTLVPTLVRGVNTHNLGEILRLAVQLSPAVKGIHFQPVTYLGRYPDAVLEENEDDEIYETVSNPELAETFRDQYRMAKVRAADRKAELEAELEENLEAELDGEQKTELESDFSDWVDEELLDELEDYRAFQEEQKNDWDSEGQLEEDLEDYLEDYLQDSASGSEGDGRYTLDELLADFCEQTGLDLDIFLPSRCDHALCGFHGSFYVDEKMKLVPLSGKGTRKTEEASTTPEENRHFVGSRWSGSKSPENCCCCAEPELIIDEPEQESCCCCSKEPEPDVKAVADTTGPIDLDVLIDRIKNHALTISAMAFQDAMNLNLERMARCSLHVYREGKLLPFCGNYLTPM